MVGLICSSSSAGWVAVSPAITAVGVGPASVVGTEGVQDAKNNAAIKKRIILLQAAEWRSRFDCVRTKGMSSLRSAKRIIFLMARLLEGWVLPAMSQLASV